MASKTIALLSTSSLQSQVWVLNSNSEHVVEIACFPFHLHSTCTHLFHMARQQGSHYYIDTCKSLTTFWNTSNTHVSAMAAIRRVWVKQTVQELCFFPKTEGIVHIDGHRLATWSEFSTWEKDSTYKENISITMVLHVHCTYMPHTISHCTCSMTIIMHMCWMVQPTN